MKAAVLHAIGARPRFEDFSESLAAEGEAIVAVRAAALKPVDKQIADGTHYAKPREVPVVCGLDGVGVLEDGTRVYFAGPRRPFGAMAERAPVGRMRCFPLPDGLDDFVAAAIVNPGVSAWLTLAHRAKIAAGDRVLILGATGTTGRLAVQIARILGAGRVVAAGRNETILAQLRELGADATISLSQPDEALKSDFAREAGEAGFSAVIDYLWGRPTEILIAAITRAEFAPATGETRLVQVGESAGSTIALPAAVLRSTPLTIMGTAGIPSAEILELALKEVMSRASRGDLRIEVTRVPLAQIEEAWGREDPLHRRIVIVP
jgi:NADPH:quinone reductase-like Zn-dependent oxidoreductase